MAKAKKYLFLSVKAYWFLSVLYTYEWKDQNDSCRQYQAYSS